ncbi:MAG: hypothetical protein OQK24_12585 [Magnetovibrio sp.]|nr:hypothetical protein [Magnetovibrio sp.]
MIEQAVRPRWAIGFGVFLGIFGILTIKSGGEVLFIDGVGRKAAGDYVPFVLWFNFLAGFAYLAGAVGLSLWRSWIKPLSITIAGLTILVFIAFGIHILMDGTFEMRTVGAMTLRSLVWISVALSVRRKFP